MCGRYASSRKPEDLVEEFEIRTSKVDEALAPDYNVAPTKPVYAVMERSPSARDDPEPRAARAAAARAHLGSGAVVGEGPRDRQPDDQRADGDGGREAGVQAGLRVASLPAPGRRLLRVVPHPADREVGQAAQAAVLHPPARRRGAGDGRPLRDLARPLAAGRRSRSVPLDLHGAHHPGGGRRRAHPRPDADDGRARPLGGLARPGVPRATACSRCWCRPLRGGSRPIRCPPTSTTSATTGRAGRADPGRGRPLA